MNVAVRDHADGESEVVMGQAIKEFGWKRNDLVISTKVFIQIFLVSLAPGQDHGMQEGGIC